MIFRTPSDLLTYLSTLAQQHPMVSCVITGVMSRPEAGTTSTNTYPLVLIEWPAVKKPRSEQPLRMNTNIFVLSTAPDGDYTAEDIAISDTYQIAINLVAAIQEHSLSDDYGLTLSSGEITIDSIEYLGSDQMRGWSFSLEFEINQSPCKDMPYDPATFIMPAFTWRNILRELDPEGSAMLEFTDESIVTDDSISTWYFREEYQQPEATEFNPEDGLEIGLVVGAPADRVAEVWIKMTDADEVHTFWAYARIPSSVLAGRSSAFTPSYPI